MKAYRGYVTATASGLLLGGVKHHESAAFETPEQAQDWVSVIVRTNCEANRLPSAWGVKMVDDPRPIALAPLA